MIVSLFIAALFPVKYSINIPNVNTFMVIRPPTIPAEVDSALFSLKVA
jgi:hypothetical protein